MILQRSFGLFLVGGIGLGRRDGRDVDGGRGRRADRRTDDDDGAMICAMSVRTTESESEWCYSK